MDLEGAAQPHAFERLVPTGIVELVINLTEDESRVYDLCCRLRRPHEVLQRATSARVVEWMGLALDCGYDDQAHFVRDFQVFSRLTRSAWSEAHCSQRRTEWQKRSNPSPRDTTRSPRTSS